MTGYTKLFGSIVASTIWREKDATRVVWITILALADKNGEVQASLPGLADLSRVSLADCKEAVATLESPDEYSRTTEHEGRRIERISGGWLVLNHAAYREKRNADERREYLRQKKQESRDRKRAKTPADVQGMSTNGQHGQQIVNGGQHGQPQSTQAEAEAQAEDRGASPSKTPLSLVASLPRSPLPQAEAGEVKGNALTPAQKKEREELKSLSLQVNPIMRRRADTEWSMDEKTWLKKNRKSFTLENIALVLRFHRADIAKDKDFRRQDMLRLVRHFPGEVDKAKKHFGIDKPNAPKPDGGFPAEWPAFIAYHANSRRPENADALRRFKTWKEAQSVHRDFEEWRDAGKPTKPEDHQ